MLRKGLSLGLLVLVIVSSISISFQVRRITIMNPEALIGSAEVSNSAVAINMTWTSRWISNPQPVENYSFLVGDHVVLNATYVGPSVVTMVELFFVDLNITVASTSRSILYDTYQFVGNSTQNVHVTALDSLNESIAQKYYLNVSFGNWFSPQVTANYPHEIETNFYNVTWSSTDRNANDTSFYQAWLSADGGVSYFLVANNLTESFYLWNSTGFPHRDDCIWRIRAFSVDLTVYPGPFINIPSDYWPGDFGDGFSIPFAHDGPFWATISIVPALDLSYILGEQNHRISWNLTIGSGFLPGSLNYTILHNDSEYSLGSVPISGNTNPCIILTLNNLDVGTHLFTLVLDYAMVPNDKNSDSVLVIVLPGSQVPPLDVLVYLAGGMMLGSIFLIAACILKQRKSHV